jgi:hypothetical protein
MNTCLVELCNNVFMVSYCSTLCNAKIIKKFVYSVNKCSNYFWLFPKECFISYARRYVISESLLTTRKSSSYLQFLYAKFATIAFQKVCVFKLNLSIWTMYWTYKMNKCL